MHTQFPTEPLSRYINADRERKTGVRLFMEDLRAWLKANRLTFAWLADNMGKSEGTVKNWFYSGLNLDDEKLERIMKLCRTHLSGGQGISYAAGANSMEIAYVWMEPFYCDAPDVYLDDEDDEFLKNDIGSMPPLRVTPEDCNYAEWSLAAGVPEDTLWNAKTDYYPAFAKWATEVVMQATRNVLAAARKQGKLRLDIKTDGRGIPQNGLIVSYFWVGQKETTHAGNEWIIKAENIAFNIPVIMSEWRSDYLRLAAAMSGYEWTDQWIIAVLNDASAKQRENDLDDFLRGE